ncbi:MAG: RraA family protein [Pseudomonadota bacterium]
MLKEPPLLEIKRTWPRPDLDRLAAFDGAQTGHLVDALSGRGALDAAIKPVAADASSFIGTALPVLTGPNDNLAIIAAVAKARPGDVVVAASESFSGSAVVGDIAAMMAKNAGCRAIVIDGMARDLVGIEAVGLPVFAKGITPNSCVKSGPGRVGFPVVAGGVQVAPGDIVMGDRDGVVVVPRERLEEVAGKVQAIREVEAGVIKDVEQGLTTFPFMEELLNSDRVTYVD